MSGILLGETKPKKIKAKSEYADSTVRLQITSYIKQLVMVIKF